MLAEASPARPTVTHQRARGRAAVSFHAKGGRTRLDDLHQSGCLKLRLLRAHGPVPEAVLINTAGGLTGGDRLAVEASVGAGARAMLATQTAERLYRSIGGTASMEISLRAEAGSRLAWLPQETIAFEGSALRRRLDVNLAPDARFLAVEPLVMGRAAMGERIERAFLRDDWRVRIDGRLVHTEALRIGPNARSWLERTAGWNGAIAAATVLLVAPVAPDLVRPARECVGTLGAVDAWEGPQARLVARLLAPDGLALRRALLPLLSLLNGSPLGLGCATSGHGEVLPAVWSL